MRYKVELFRGGALMQSFYVPAVKAYITGDYINGQPYRPDDSAVAKILPYHYRAAFRRDGFWYGNPAFRPGESFFRADLNRKRDNAPIGVVVARYERGAV